MRQRDPVGSSESDKPVQDPEEDNATPKLGIVPSLPEPVAAGDTELLLPPSRSVPRGEVLTQPVPALPWETLLVADTGAAELPAAVLAAALEEPTAAAQPWQADLGAATLALGGFLAWSAEAHRHRASKRDRNRCASCGL